MDIVGRDGETALKPNKETGFDAATADEDDGCRSGRADRITADSEEADHGEQLASPFAFNRSTQPRIDRVARAARMVGQAAKIRHWDKPGLHLRVVVRDGVALGPGRADLLERVQDLGSIAAAARDLRMSYRRAWMLIDSTSKEFGAPLIAATPGGTNGGRAQLTELGVSILGLYRRIEAKAMRAVADELETLRLLAIEEE